MTHSLADSLSSFSRRRLKLEKALLNLQAMREQRGRLERWALQEAYTSWLWQIWCSFCREVIVESAKTAIKVDGSSTISAYSNRPEWEILYVSRQAALNQGFANLKPLSGMYQEPTWGDVAKISKVASALRLSNASSITGGLAAINAALDLQIVRNACSHFHVESVASIEKIRARYNKTSYAHPSDALYWEDPVLKSAAWSTWVIEIEYAAKKMVS